ncbi:hypothetical protein MRB53_037210 [Persea americana]|nr:hypothetical protein MRB53_037210 [Persea americana]
MDVDIDRDDLNEQWEAQFPSLRAGGQGIDIRTAGVSVMRKMPGMEAAVRAKTTTIEGISLVRSDGRPYGVLRATGDPDQQSLVSEFEIFRDRAIEQGETVDGPVMVDFANGKLPRTEFDLVVACDGATSRTRALGLGCGVRDHIKSMNMWSAYFTLQKDHMKEARSDSSLRGTGRFMAIGPDQQT